MNRASLMRRIGALAAAGPLAMLAPKLAPEEAPMTFASKDFYIAVWGNDYPMSRLMLGPQVTGKWLSAFPEDAEIRIWMKLGNGQISPRLGLTYTVRSAMEYLQKAIPWARAQGLPTDHFLTIGGR